jgi:hypothetical protein
MTTRSALPYPGFRKRMSLCKQNMSHAAAMPDKNDVAIKKALIEDINPPS